MGVVSETDSRPNVWLTLMDLRGTGGAATKFRIWPKYIAARLRARARPQRPSICLLFRSPKLTYSVRIYISSNVREKDPASLLPLLNLRQIFESLPWRFFSRSRLLYAERKSSPVV